MRILKNVDFHIKWDGLMNVGVSQVVLVVKNSLVNAGDIRDVGLIPGLGRSPGEGNCNPLQYSCLGSPMERGVWRAIVPGVIKEKDMA